MTRRANGVYMDLLARKSLRVENRGVMVDANDLAPHLFPFQSQCVSFNLATGRGGRGERQ